MLGQAKHIILLPPACDGAWVSALNGYAQHFQASVSQREDDVAVADAGQLAITVIDTLDGWEGDIASQLEQRFPDVDLDVIQVSDPQALGEVLAERVATGDRFGERQTLMLEWPTEEDAEIQQRFGASPWIYREWTGLPGHEGIDFSTCEGAPILACADGDVYFVDLDHPDQPDSHPYGNQVRIRHRLGKGIYHTIYAHLADVQVTEGQRVSRGQQIGTAHASDDERSPKGRHFHLSLRHEGTGAPGYAMDLVDPELYLVRPDGWRLKRCTELPHVFGVHEDVDHEMARFMQAAGVNGYILWSEEVGASLACGNVGRDYAQEAGSFGHTAIVRLNYGYEPNGTLPVSSRYAEFAQCCANWVDQSEGCRIWIVGNEPNNRHEHPLHECITPELYAECFNTVYKAIKEVQPDSIVTLAPVHPTDTAMGDPRSYFRLVLEHLEDVDAFALHAFTHGPDPAYVTSSHKFQLPPLDWQFFHFRMFEPFIEAIPEKWRHLPVYITAVHHVFKAVPRDLGWLDHNNGWVWEVYRYVDEWNRRGGQQVHCVLLYRYPELDDWAIRGRTQVLEDFLQTMGMGYRPYYPRHKADSGIPVTEPPAWLVGTEETEFMSGGVAISTAEEGAASVEIAVAQNILVNGSFEAEWSADGGHRCIVIPNSGVPEEREIGNIFAPPGWLPWFRHNPGQWDQPEVRDAWAALDPRRVHSGQKATMLFTFYRRHDAGFLQQVSVAPGTRVRLSAWAHAWSNHALAGHKECEDDPYCSCGVGRDTFAALEGTLPDAGADPWVAALGNFTFRVGIDPTGGINPFAGTVIWGQGVHSYNAHAQVPSVEATATASTVTVFLRSTTRWAFKHNDAYWDDAELVSVDTSPALLDVQLSHSPDLPKVGDTVTIVARATGGLTNVRFSLQTPSGAQVALSDIHIGSDGGWITWTVTCLLQEQGTYEAVLTADQDVRVVHTFGCEFAPVGARGAPRVQYQRTYVLMPPQAGEEWALAVVDSTWDQRRYTIGGSADDAGIGDLDFRRVIAVNPERWGGDLQGFFAVYYPNVHYEVINAGTPDELREELKRRA